MAAGLYDLTCYKGTLVALVRKYSSAEASKGLCTAGLQTILVLLEEGDLAFPLLYLLAVFPFDSSLDHVEFDSLLLVHLTRHNRSLQGA